MEIQEIKKLVIQKFPEYANPKFKFSWKGNKLGKGGGIWKDIENFDPSLKTDLEKFLTEGKIPEREEKGYTFSRLTGELGMNPIGAFLTFQWITEDPEEAIDALKQGFDEIGKPEN